MSPRVIRLCFPHARSCAAAAFAAGAQCTDPNPTLTTTSTLGMHGRDKLRVGAQVRVFAACAAGGTHALQQARMPDGALLIASAPTGFNNAAPAARTGSGAASGACQNPDPDPEPLTSAPGARAAAAAAGERTEAPGAGQSLRPKCELPAGCTAVQRIPAGWSKYGWQADPQPWAKPQEDLQRSASQARPRWACVSPSCLAAVL